MKGFFAILLVIFSGLPVSGQEVKITLDDTGTLSGGETFRVDQGELITLGDDETDGGAFYAMMKAAVAGQLEDKG
ncbi:MAG TPA: hypothetical protein VD816_11260, partial [Ohtaekwangia sp.]|nr:hypothetical protein [Ohtaekwangia sp.]